MSAPPPRVTIEPPGSRWPALIRERWEKSRQDERSMLLRRELGLPTDRPIIMSGHQALVWHPGIAAKVFAAASAAERSGGAAAWIVVDQDEHEFSTIAVPVRDSAGRLHSEELPLAARSPAGIAAASLPPVDAALTKPKKGAFALPSVSWGLASIVESLLSRRAEASAARQVAEATFDLLGPFVPRPILVYATSLARTTLMRALVERLQGDPAHAGRTYNDSLGIAGEAGLVPLRAEPERNRWELPLWRLRDGKPRERVWNDGTWPIESLAPRALLMTGILRLGACDLFIHGTGGALYDRATEAWFREWLGESLAPMAVTTADLLLPFDEGAVTKKEAARTIWRAHRARHDPAIVGREDLAREKSRLVEAVRAARESGGDALSAYRTLHRMLEEYRREEVRPIERVSFEADRMRAMLASLAVARDRRWAFPLHSRERLQALARAVGTFA